MNATADLEEVESGYVLNDPDVRVVDAISVGQCIRQGDVYITCVSDDHLRGDVVDSRKLAVGTTQGARRFAVGDVDCFAGVKCPDFLAGEMPIGPLVVARDRWVVEHPEHADCSLPSGTYQITH